MISWQAPPSFNEPITAFEIQYKIPGQDDWGPNPAITTPPHYRQKTIKDLSPATTYQFRLRATNKMGISEWGAMSKYVRFSSFFFLFFFSKIYLVIFLYSVVISFYVCRSQQN